MPVACAKANKYKVDTMLKTIAAKKNKIFFLFGIVLVQLLFAISSARGQNVTVSGTVTDSETGGTLPGVNVIVKGTTKGTSTDSEGNYQLNVASLQDTLSFSFVGYQTKDVPIQGRKTVNVSLLSETIQGEEMVVVGYGTQRREDVTGSVASVPIEDLDSQSVTGIDQAITGKVSGVRVNNVSGVPGGGPTIRIRGVGSIGAGNDPLYVVDGFPIPNSSGQRSNPLNSIAPSQIESIEVLKDASATAIYGSRGANGVILITTKRGTRDTQIEINSSVGLQSVRERGMVDVLNAREFAQFRKDALSDRVRFQENREPIPSDIPGEYRNPEQYGAGTDWPNEIFENALMHNQNFSISGGNESVRSVLSASFLDQQGTLLDTGYKRYNFRVNVDATVSDKFSAGLRIAPSLEKQELGETDGSRTGAVGSAYLINPIVSVRNSEGDLRPMVDGPGLLPFVNPVFKLQEIDHTLTRGRAIGNIYAEYELLRGLAIKSSLNFDWSDTRQKVYEPTTVGGFNTYPPDAAIASNSSSETLNWLNENTVNYKTDIGANHSLDALFGFSVQKETVESANFNARDFPDDEIQTFNAAPNIDGATNVAEWGLVSTLARVNYDYKDKYLLTATIRRDGSSRFGSESKWGTFPSFSAGWRISDEKFLNSTEFINNLLVRVGYGQSGNFNIGNYAFLGTVNTTNYALDSQQVSGRSITSLGNPGLGWEEVEQLNIGLDASFIENRLNITLDYYKGALQNPSI